MAIQLSTQLYGSVNSIGYYRSTALKAIVAEIVNKTPLLSLDTVIQNTSTAYEAIVRLGDSHMGIRFLASDSSGYIYQYTCTDASGSWVNSSIAYNYSYSQLNTSGTTDIPVVVKYSIGFIGNCFGRIAIWQVCGSGVSQYATVSDWVYGKDSTSNERIAGIAVVSGSPTVSTKWFSVFLRVYTEGYTAVVPGGTTLKHLYLSSTADITASVLGNAKYSSYFFVPIGNIGYIENSAGYANILYGDSYNVYVLRDKSNKNISYDGTISINGVEYTSYGTIYMLKSAT